MRFNINLNEQVIRFITFNFPDFSDWSQPETAADIRSLFRNRKEANAEVRSRIETSLKGQKNLQASVSEILTEDDLADLDPVKLVSGLIRNSRTSNKNQIFRFETGSVLNFPSQTDLPLIHFDPRDKARIEQLVAEEILDDVIKAGSIVRGSGPVTEVVASLLKAIMTALEFNSKWLFAQLVKPLMKVAVHLNPLPEYQVSDEVEDGSLGGIKFIDMVMDNWGHTLHSKTTRRIFYPETLAGIQNVVKKAASEGKRVRASGMRHTWNPWMWGVDNELDPIPTETEDSVDYFLALVPNEVSDKLSYARGTSEDWRDRAHELTEITGPLKVWTENGERKASVKIGGATLNQHLLEWIMTNTEWTLPANTIMLLMTMSGTTSTMCHGGGLQHKSLSDRIIGLEYVDSEGEVRTVEDPEHLKAAAGAMGMLGIIVSITLKMDVMTYARWGPRKITDPMEEYWSRPGEALSQEAVAMFEDHYYAEWIAFPRHHTGGRGLIWQNVWSNDGLAEESTTLITYIEEAYEISYQFLAEVANLGFKVVLEAYDAEDFLYWLYGWMTGVASNLAMPDLPEPVTTSTTEALHFQRGLHTLVEKAMEMNIPIPDDGSGNPDWTIVQKAWWAGQDVIKGYEDNGSYPIDFAMEMRLMSGSDVYMAPYYGNDLGTVSIEVVSSTLVPNGLWEDFKNTIAEAWAKLTDKDGNPLKIRPHWAKEFPARIGDRATDDYLKLVYGDQMGLFMNAIKDIVVANGGSIESTKERFSNYFLDNFFEKYW